MHAALMYYQYVRRCEDRGIAANTYDTWMAFYYLPYLH